MTFHALINARNIKIVADTNVIHKIHIFRRGGFVERPETSEGRTPSRNSRSLLLSQDVSKNCRRLMFVNIDEHLADLLLV